MLLCITDDEPRIEMVNTAKELSEAPPSFFSSVYHYQLLGGLFLFLYLHFHYSIVFFFVCVGGRGTQSERQTTFSNGLCFTNIHAKMVL